MARSAARAAGVRAGAPPGKVYVIGAGLAGLSAAVSLAGRGVRVELIEAAAAAGGRCRSYVDPVLGLTIDNGNHLVLSGNRATFRYLRAIGAAERLLGPEEARFAFHDVRRGRGWTIRPNLGPLPWWVLRRDRRVPGSRGGDYLALLALMRAPAPARVDQVIACAGPLWERLMEPFLLAALNTEPAGASARLAGAVIRESLARGGRAYRPRIAHPSLSAAFIDPALAWLEGHGAAVPLGRRLRALTFAEGRVSALALGDGEQTVGPADAVILAVPPWVAADLIPGLVTPDRFSAIVNGHFRIDPPAGAPAMIGVIGGTAQWIFAFPGRLSVTMSAADALVDADREGLARALWADVAAVHGLTPDLPPWQIVKERRATFAATADQAVRRPGAATPYENLFLAGDWTATGLPATIEGAIRSGMTAVKQMIALQIGRRG
ncbi:MAG: hydroxysqualene dehydroxylase HpnE [Caulobacteraceae bacterium]